MNSLLTEGYHELIVLSSNPESVWSMGSMDFTPGSTSRHSRRTDLPKISSELKTTANQ